MPKLSELKRIGWIGAGKMGLPICLRYKQAGHQVTALARTVEAQEKLNAKGLTAVETIADVAQNSDIVFSSLSDDIALISVAAELAISMAKITTFIDISTVSPSVSAEVAQVLIAKSIVYLRAPVSGSTAMAEAGTLTAVVSGPKPSFDDLASVFAVFARKTFHVGEGEEARVMKLVLNSMVAATSALLGEALAYGASGGLDNATMLSVINQSAVASPLIGYKTDMIVKGNYAAAATLNMLKKDLELLLAAAKTKQTLLPVNSLIKEIYAAAVDKGLGEMDFFALVQEAENAATPRPSSDG